MGMRPAEPALTPPSPPSYMAVQLDGKIIGHVPAAFGKVIVGRLNSIKAAVLSQKEGIPANGTLPILKVTAS